MICGQLAPQFQFFYVGGVVVQVHAVCGDLKTKDENGRQLKISDGRDAWDTEPETSVGHTPRLWSSNVLP